MTMNVKELRMDVLSPIYCPLRDKETKKCHMYPYALCDCHREIVLDGCKIIIETFPEEGCMLQDKPIVKALDE